MQQTPEVVRKIFLRRSKQMWVLHDEANHTILVAGIVEPSQMSTPELWVLLCEPFKKRLRALLPQMKLKLDELLELYPHLKVRVDAETPGGRKLVEFLGFTEYHRDAPGNGREYIYYEVHRGVRSDTSGT